MNTIQRITLVLLCGLLGLPPAGLWFGHCARAQATEARDEVDTDAADELDTDATILIYPSPIWSRSAGFSAGIGYRIDDLFFRGGSLLATAKPGQHRGRYTLTAFVRDPYRDPVYGLLNGYYETTGRQWYYGLGPRSSRDDEIAVELTTVEAEARFGILPGGGPVFIQPSIRYLRYVVDGFREFDDGALERLTRASRDNLRFAAGLTPGSDNVQDGIGLGLDVGLDLRDAPFYTREGLLLQGAYRRYLFQTPSDLAFERYEVYGYYFLPVGSNVLTLRVVSMLTESLEENPVPFYMLPSLHGDLLPGYSWDRFVGNDLFVGTLEYSMPLFNFFDFAAVDALLTMGVGNVYDDLFEDLMSTPLKPSIGAGLHLVTFGRTPWSFRGLIGWGTDGIRLVRFGLVQDLRDIELGKR